MVIMISEYFMNISLPGIFVTKPYRYFFKKLLIDWLIFGYAWPAALWGFSCAEQGLRFVRLHCGGLSLQSTGSRHTVAVSHRPWSMGSVLWYTDPVALRHEELSRTRIRTCVACIGRKISIHCTTRENLETHCEVTFEVVIIKSSLYSGNLLCSILLYFILTS